MPDNAETVLHKLLAYCKANDWAGYDPYDALNSRIFTAVPFLNSRIPRLILTQALKRSPVNIRRQALIPKTQNPKALALFLSAFVKFPNNGYGDCESLAESMIERLFALRSPNVAFWCWGYSFPWQGRSVLVPRAAPNLVCTTFVADALVDAYEQRQDSACLAASVSAAEYIVNELYWEDADAVGFSYPMPTLKSETHNANLLAAALLCRVYRHTGEEKFLRTALRVARYAVTKQHSDGSWYYGEESSSRWIDNFHTGYNLCALQSIGEYAETAEFESSVRLGFDFYQNNFFSRDGSVKYFHDRTYPIDIHCVAQSIITLLAFKNLDTDNIWLANAVFRWAVANMWDDRGYFYYRIHRFGKVRTSYMRWSQAWMFLAISKLVFQERGDSPDTIEAQLVHRHAGAS